MQQGKSKIISEVVPAPGSTGAAERLVNHLRLEGVLPVALPPEEPWFAGFP